MDRVDPIPLGHDLFPFFFGNNYILSIIILTIITIITLQGLNFILVLQGKYRSVILLLWLLAPIPQRF